jgi:hypothetical protein
MKIKTIPAITAGFILLIVGLVIIIRGIFYTIPTDETTLTWAFIIIVGICLILVGIATVYFSTD